MTKKKITTSSHTYADVFLGTLDRLELEEQLRFRNCLGRTLSQCPEAQIQFYSLVPPRFNLTKWEEDVFFLATTMYFHIPHNPKMWNLGHTFNIWKRKDPQRAEYITAVFSDLQGAATSDIIYRIVNVANSLKNVDGLAINYRVLICDLLDWDKRYHIAQYHWQSIMATPQRQWARAFMWGFPSEYFRIEGKTNQQPAGK